MMMRDGFDTFMRILRLLGTLGFCSVFMYWSFTAISKYTEGPISSTVSYQYGDDGHGYIDFPAITICLNSFNWIIRSAMSKNCSYGTGYGTGFMDTLSYCTEDNTQTKTTTTNCDGIFGCMFEEENDVYPFKNIEDLLDASKIIDITDILSQFQFGQTSIKNMILLSQDFLISDVKEGLLYYWKPILHYSHGFCYTFEPKRYTKFPVLYKGELLSMTLKFEFKDIFEKLNNTGFCGHVDCSIRYGYYVLIHDSGDSLINEFDTAPFFKVRSGETIFAKISKINLDSIATEKNPCNDNVEKRTGTECLLHEADNLVFEKYNCTLPWTKDKRTEICPIIDKHRNENYDDIMATWNSCFYSSKNHGCSQMPMCKRSFYKLAIEPEPNIYVGHSTMGSVVKIQLASPNVLTIKDSVAYDLQSLIGEVGGTLGLFLGLSTMSFIDLFEFIFRKLFS